METDVEELEQDTSILLPVVTALVIAVAAEKAGTIPGEAATEAVEAVAKLEKLLADVALRVLSALAGILPAAKRSRVNQHMDAAVEAVVEKVAKSARDSADKVDTAEEVPDQKMLARRLASAARNGARQEISERVAADGLTMRKTWHSVKDTRVRPSHAFLGDRSYEFHSVPVNEKFVTIDGHKLMFPGDPTAPLSETAGCRCWMSVR